VLVNPGFSKPKRFFRKLSAIWASDLRNLRRPCRGPNIFKKCRFEGAFERPRAGPGVAIGSYLASGTGLNKLEWKYCSF
jgi:hypothetical protein